MAVLSQMDVLERSDPPIRGRVRPPRYPVDVTARLRIGSHLLIVRTLDVSRGGAKLVLSEPRQRALLTRGAVVLMNADCLPIPKLAAVSWLRGDQVGLCFREPLREADVAGLRRRH